VKKTLSAAGAIRMEEAIAVAGGGSWTMLACIDRMVELGEIREIKQADVFCQHRVFIESC
jgi:hypothetical protein